MTSNLRILIIPLIGLANYKCSDTVIVALYLYIYLPPKVLHVYITIEVKDGQEKQRMMTKCWQ